MVVQVSAALLWTLLPANVPGEATPDGLSTEAAVTHMADLEGVLGSWTLSDPVLTIIDIWGVDHWMETSPYV